MRVPKYARALLSLFALLPAFAADDGMPLPRAMNFPADIPVAERRPESALPGITPFDAAGAVVARFDGAILVTSLEDFRAKSRRSIDNGRSFSAETIVPTDAGGSDLDVQQALITVPRDRSSTSTEPLYMSMLVADPSGAMGLRVTSTTDLGATWSTPVTVVQAGDDTHGLTNHRIAAYGTNDVAIVYTEDRGGDVYAVASSDGGTTWTQRVRLNTGVADGSGQFGPIAVAVDASGNVHAMFVEDRGAGSQVFYTRSTDGGLTFAPESTFDLLLPARASSTNPLFYVKDTGELFVTFWDAADLDHVYVLRSVDDGASFSLRLDQTQNASDIALSPQLAFGTSSSNGILHLVDDFGRLVVQSTSDGGLSFGSPQFLTSGGVGGAGASFGESETGAFVLVYEDHSADPYIGRLSDLYLRISTNGGASWGAAARVDGTPAASTETRLASGGSVAGSDDNELFVLYLDGRDENVRSWNLYGNYGSAADTSTFVNEARIDADSGTREPFARDFVSVATDRGGPSGTQTPTVWVAMATLATGPETEIRVARSTDGGVTFPDAVRISDSAGAEQASDPRLVATADGDLYAAYTVFDSASFLWELRFNRSTDGGLTWLPGEVGFGPLTVSGGGYGHFDLTAQDGGRVQLIWTAQGSLMLARSTDSGASFTQSTIDVSPGSYDLDPRLCVVGDNFFASFASEDDAFVYLTTYLRISTDAGASFGPREKLFSDSLSGGVNWHHTDCFRSDAPGNPVYWVAGVDDRRAGIDRATVTRYELGVGQLTDTFLGSGANPELISDVACRFDGMSDECWFSYQENVADPRGAWDTVQAVRLDVATGAVIAAEELTVVAPLPSAVSDRAELVSDGQGNLWAAWLDWSAGNSAEHVVRHWEPVGGWGPLYRLSRNAIQGAYANTVVPNVMQHQSVAASPERAYFVWAGQRESYHLNALLNVYDLQDFDQDGFSSGADCSDSSAATYPGAPETNDGLDNQCSGDTGFGLIDEISGTSGFQAPDQFCWEEQAGATSYEVARSTSPDFTTDCTSFTTGGSCITDPQTPPTGQTFYYAVRATAPNLGSWGADASGSERVGLCGL